MQQCIQLTGTNKSCDLFFFSSLNFNPKRLKQRVKFFSIKPYIFAHRSKPYLLATIEERSHPTPFRTRKLSSPSPMILLGSQWESRSSQAFISKAPLLIQGGFLAFLCIFYIPAPFVKCGDLRFGGDAFRASGGSPRGASSGTKVWNP